MVTLERLICRTKLWIQQVSTAYEGKIEIELLADHEYLEYLLTTEHYWAEFCITPKGFQPFRHVSFIALDLRKDISQSFAYCYYDDDESTEADIFNGLDDGIAYIIN